MNVCMNVCMNECSYVLYVDMYCAVYMYMYLQCMPPEIAPKKYISILSIQEMCVYIFLYV